MALQVSEKIRSSPFVETEDMIGGVNNVANIFVASSKQRGASDFSPPYQAMLLTSLAVAR